MKLFRSRSDSLVSLDSHSPDILHIVLKVLRTILVDNAQEWFESTPAIKDLLATVLGIYQRGKFPKEIRTRVLIMLCDIVLDHKLYHLYGQNVFSNWLSTLPTLLCQPYVSPHVLKTFSHLSRQKNPIFTKHLEANRDAIIGRCFMKCIFGQLIFRTLKFNFFHFHSKFITSSNQWIGESSTGQTRYNQSVLLAEINMDTKPKRNNQITTFKRMAND